MKKYKEYAFNLLVIACFGFLTYRGYANHDRFAIVALGVFASLFFVLALASTLLLNQYDLVEKTKRSW